MMLRIPQNLSLVKKIVLGLAIAAVLVAKFMHMAKAEVFVWHDPQYDIKASFPDNWMRQASLDDDLRLFVLAPQGSDHAACRLYARHDGRFMDAPADATREVSNFVFSSAEIQKEIFNRPEVDNVSISGVTPNQTLGRGAAASADVDFQKTWAGATYPMHALVLATQYHGDRVLMSCESLASAWPNWAQQVKGIMKSVDFKPAWSPQPNGSYRRFQDDGRVYVQFGANGNAVFAQ